MDFTLLGCMIVYANVDAFRNAQSLSLDGYFHFSVFLFMG